MIGSWALLFVFLSGVGMSFQTLFVKLIAEEGTHAAYHCIIARGFFQCLISSCVIYFDTKREEGNGSKLFGSTPYVRFILFMRCFVGYMGIMFGFSAIQIIPMGDGTVLSMLSPVVAAIVGYFILGEPWRVPEMLATAVALLGAVLVIKPPFIFGEAAQHVNNNNSSLYGIGVLYALLSSLAAGFANVFVRMLGTSAKLPWANVTFSHALAQMFLSLPAAWLFGEALLEPLTRRQVLYVLAAGLIGAPSQILLTIGLQREKSAVATAMRTSDVLFGYLWQLLFTQDAVSAMSLGGSALITLAIVMIVLSKPTDPGVTVDAASSSSSSSDGSDSSAGIELRTTETADGKGRVTHDKGYSDMDATVHSSMQLLRGHGGLPTEDSDSDDPDTFTGGKKRPPTAPAPPVVIPAAPRFLSAVKRASQGLAAAVRAAAAAATTTVAAPPAAPASSRRRRKEDSSRAYSRIGGGGGASTGRSKKLGESCVSNDTTGRQQRMEERVTGAPAAVLPAAFPSVLPNASNPLHAALEVGLEEDNDDNDVFGGLASHELELVSRVTQITGNQV
jgi:drug/metabolite transporter (DMT)-like permease